MGIRPPTVFHRYRHRHRHRRPALTRPRQRVWRTTFRAPLAVHDGGLLPSSHGTWSPCLGGLPQTGCPLPLLAGVWAWLVIVRSCQSGGQDVLFRRRRYRWRRSECRGAGLALVHRGRALECRRAVDRPGVDLQVDPCRASATPWCGHIVPLGRPLGDVSSRSGHPRRPVSPLWPRCAVAYLRIRPRAASSTCWKSFTNPSTLRCGWRRLSCWPHAGRRTAAPCPPSPSGPVWRRTPTAAPGSKQP